MISCRPLFAAIACAVLAGCGLKGPLYLPESTQQSVPAPSETEKRERTRDSGSQTPAAPTDTAPSTTTPPGN